MSEDGRKLSVNEVEEKIQEYIDRCVNEKLKEQVIQKVKISRDEEKIIKIDCDKMIVMSKYGVCSFMGIATSTWDEWRKDKKYSGIITRAEDLFKAYNIEGSSAGMLNQSIIARLEGLTDKTDLSSKDGTMTPKLEINVTSDKAKKALKDIANGND
jgi:hypothetical protein